MNNDASDIASRDDIECRLYDGSVSIMAQRFSEGHMTSDKKSPPVVTKTAMKKYYEHDSLWATLPVHASIANGAPVKIIKMLITADPSSLQTQDGNGRVPLHLAFCRGDEGIISELLSACPESFYIKDNDGKMPIKLKLAQDDDDDADDLVHHEDDDSASTPLITNGKTQGENSSFTPTFSQNEEAIAKNDILYSSDSSVDGDTNRCDDFIIASRNSADEFNFDIRDVNNYREDDCSPFKQVTVMKQQSRKTTMTSTKKNTQAENKSCLVAELRDEIDRLQKNLTLKEHEHGEALSRISTLEKEKKYQQSKGVNLEYKTKFHLSQSNYETSLQMIEEYKKIIPDLHHKIKVLDDKNKLLLAREIDSNNKFSEEENSLRLKMKDFEEKLNQQEIEYGKILEDIEEVIIETEGLDSEGAKGIISRPTNMLEKRDFIKEAYKKIIARENNLQTKLRVADELNESYAERIEFLEKEFKMKEKLELSEKEQKEARMEDNKMIDYLSQKIDGFVEELEKKEEELIISKKKLLAVEENMMSLQETNKAIPQMEETAAKTVIGFTKKLASLEEDRQDALNKISFLEEENKAIAKLQQKIDSLSHELDLKAKHAVAFDKIAEEYAEKVALLERENAENTSKLENDRSIALEKFSTFEKDSNEKIVNLVNEIAELKSTIDRNKTIENSLKEHIKKLQQLQDETKKNLVGHTEENKVIPDLRLKIKELNTKLVSKEKDYIVAVEKFANFEAKMIQFWEEHNEKTSASKETNELHLAKISALENENASKNTRHNELIREHDVILEKYSLLEDKCQVLKSKVKELADNLASRDAEHALALERMKTDCEVKLKASEKKISVLEGDNVYFEEKIIQFWEEYTERISASEKMNKLHLAKISSLENENTELIREHDITLEKISLLEDECGGFISKVKEWEALEDESNRNNEELKAEQKNALEKISLLQNEIEELQTNYTAANNELTALKKEETSLNNKISLLEDECKALKSKVNELDNKLATKDIKHVLALERISRLENNIKTDWEVQLKASEDKISALEDENKRKTEDLETEQRNALEKITMLENEIEELQTNYSAVNNELTDLKKEETSLNNKISSFEEELELRPSVEALEEIAMKLVSTEQAHSEALDEINNIEDEKKGMHEKLISIKEGIMNAKDEKTTLEKKNKEITDKMAVLKEENKLLSELRIKIRDLSGNIDSIVMERDASLTKKIPLEGENKEPISLLDIITSEFNNFRNKLESQRIHHTGMLDQIVNARDAALEEKHLLEESKKNELEILKTELISQKEYYTKEVDKITEELNVTSEKLSLFEDNHRNVESETKRLNSKMVSKEISHALALNRISNLENSIKTEWEVNLKASEDKIVELFKTLENLSQETKVAETKISALEDEKRAIPELERKAKDLDTERKNAQEKITRLENEIQGLQANYTAVSNELTALKEEETSLKNKLEEMTTKFTSTEQAHSKAVVEINTIEDEKKEMRETLVSIEGEMTNLENKIKEITNKMSTLEEENNLLSELQPKICELNNQLAMKDEKLSTLDLAHSNALNQITTLTDENRILPELQAEICKLRTDLTFKEKEFSKLDSEFKTLPDKSTIKNLTKKTTLLVNKYETTLQTNDCLEKEVTKLRAELDDRDNQLVSLKEMVTCLEDTICDLKSKSKEIEKELISMHEEELGFEKLKYEQQAQDECTKLNSEIQTLQNKNDNLSKALDKLGKSHNLALKEYASITQDNNKHITSLNNKISSIEKERDDAISKLTLIQSQANEERTILQGNISSIQSQANEEKATLQGDISKLYDSLHAMEAEADFARGEALALDQRINELSQELDVTKKELDDVLEKNASASKSKKKLMRTIDDMTQSQMELMRSRDAWKRRAGRQGDSFVSDGCCMGV